MIYLICGLERARLAASLKRIVKTSLNNDVDDMNFVKFDGTNTLVQEIVDEANYLPLGYDHKVIAIENAYFLQKEKGKSKVEADQDYDKLKKYLENPNEDVDLVFLVESLQLNEKNELVVLIKQKGNVTEIKDPTPEEWHVAVKRYVTEKLKVEIDPDALDELTSRTSGDMISFQNNAKKLALYTDHIRYEDVALMVTRPLEDNTFLLFNHLMKGDNLDAVKLFRDLKEGNVEPVTMISMLGNQFRLLNQVIYLIKSGNSVDDVAKELNIKTGRVHVLRKYAPIISEECIYKVLEDLFNLDLQIKSGQIDRYYGFELFLINFKIN